MMMARHGVGCADIFLLGLKLGPTYGKLLSFEIYWLQTDLYTRLLVNVTKRIKITNLRHTFLHQYLDFFN